MWTVIVSKSKGERNKMCYKPFSRQLTKFEHRKKRSLLGISKLGDTKSAFSFLHKLARYCEA
jgi:hypothetical protein